GAALPVQIGQLLIGTGVDATRVQRSVDELLGRRIQGQRSVLGALDAQRGGLGTFESLFAEPGDNGLSKLLEGFFSSVSQLSTAPTDSILRTSTVQAADAVTGRFRDLARSLGDATSDAMADVSSRVQEVNQLADQIVQLNQQIGETESVNLSAN